VSRLHLSPTSVALEVAGIAFIVAAFVVYALPEPFKAFSLLVAFWAGATLVFAGVRHDQDRAKRLDAIGKDVTGHISGFWDAPGFDERPRVIRLPDDLSVDPPLDLNELKHQWEALWSQQTDDPTEHSCREE
jgi:hypothetical protein